MTKKTDQVRRDWQTLGDRDPLWAVLVRPGMKNGGWVEGEFLATGRNEVDGALAHLASLGVTPGTEQAIDFGCGAGRTTLALSHHFSHVVGVDVSPAMLAKAEQLDTSDGRCSFVLNESDDLSLLPDGTFDLAYSSLVLQHLPPADARAALAELARVTKPGGALIVQVPTKTLRNIKGLLFKYAPWPLLRFGQRVVLRYPAPMRMHPFPETDLVATLSAHAVDVLDRVEDHTNGGHWTYHRYFGVKRA